MQHHGAVASAQSPRHGGHRIDRWARHLRLTNRDRIVAVMSGFRVLDIPIKGTVVITQRYVGFCPSFNGLRQAAAVRIKYSDLVSVSKEKVYYLFPTGVRITTCKKTVVFSSVGSREKLMKQIISAWEAWKSLPHSRRGSSDQTGTAEQYLATAAAGNLSVDSGVDSSLAIGQSPSGPREELHEQHEQEHEQNEQEHEQHKQEHEQNEQEHEQHEQEHGQNEQEDKHLPKLWDNLQETEPSQHWRKTWVVRIQKAAAASKSFLPTDEWLSCTAIIAVVLLTVCAVSAVCLTIRLLSLQEQVLALESEQQPERLLITTQNPGMFRDALSSALNDLSSQLTRLRQSLTDVEDGGN